MTNGKNIKEALRNHSSINNNKVMPDWRSKARVRWTIKKTRKAWWHSDKKTSPFSSFSLPVYLYCDCLIGHCQTRNVVSKVLTPDHKVSQRKVDFTLRDNSLINGSLCSDCSVVSSLCVEHLALLNNILYTQLKT